ncbi:Crp/Fnr family transcriptional regulator [Bacillus spongiae]|uniref:Crp/Fnr family transcriptional regulator n=1 Tax=Bacillus spongiae TaxID=2683610 RepID=A0ABU8H8B9_9BACI
MNEENISQLLSTFPIFKDLQQEEIEKVVKISFSRTFIKGSHVFLQEDPLENVYFIYKGRIKIYKSELNGKEQIVSILKEGDMFPHVGFFRKGNYPAFSEVLDNAELVVVPIEQFEQILIENPKLCIRIFNILGSKIVDLQERLQVQLLNNTHDQVIKLLIRISKTHGEHIQGDTYALKVAFSNSELASMIGLTRETISRTLSKLRKAKVIHVDEHGHLYFSIQDLVDNLENL